MHDDAAVSPEQVAAVPCDAELTAEEVFETIERLTRK